MTPNDPKLTLDPKIYVEGLKMIDMRESHGHAM